MRDQERYYMTAELPFTIEPWWTDANLQQRNCLKLCKDTRRQIDRIEAGFTSKNLKNTIYTLQTAYTYKLDFIARMAHGT